MTVDTPTAQLDGRYSSADATPVTWAEAKRRLAEAELYWVTTVRPDGRPHVTPLIAVWMDEALYFCTGPDERKNRNIERNSRVLLSTGCNTLHEGLDIVVEGDAVRSNDEARLQRIADGFFSKYGDEWRFSVRDGEFHHDTGSIRETDTGGALVYEVRPKTAFGFGKGEPYSQTRWRF